MISKPAVTGVLLLLGATFACGRERTAQASELQRTDEAVLTVKNDYLNDVAVYAIRAGSKTRVATVYGFKTETIPLKASILSGASAVRLLIEPLGSNATHVTEPITVLPGDSVELTVRNPINLSSVTVLHR
jgi:hypothetical protein